MKDYYHKKQGLGLKPGDSDPRVAVAYGCLTLVALAAGGLGLALIIIYFNT